MKALRLLLDQMLARDVAEALVAQGHDVMRVSQLGMGEADDSAILGKAIELGRILVTLDEHFGDWSVLPLSNHPGVIRVKAESASSGAILAVLLPFLDGYSGRDFRNKLVIVRPPNVRWISTGI
jgi:predicted nuclease of predicted toxin-antitoxin system